MSSAPTRSSTLGSMPSVSSRSRLNFAPMTAAALRVPFRLLLNAQGGQACTDGVIFQRDRRAEHRHDPVASELCDRAAVTLHHRGTAVGELGHDLAQPLRT